MNGKGNDFNDNLIYELKDEKGYIKEYNYNGTLAYEGEYLNGERNGRGKEYYDINKYFYYNDKLLFEGEYLNGKRNGKG